MSLIRKYNIAAPRYTSYPTVPYWEANNFHTGRWKALLKKSFLEFNDKDGISLYIHLPFCEKMCTYCGCNKHITVNHQVEAPYMLDIKRMAVIRCCFRRPATHPRDPPGWRHTYFLQRPTSNLLIERYL
ncbi:hypothetical protein ACDQ55_03475 [Chitinophaga sp. 30R24]|uniref:hypothetical protein n=1 Tax=Chitinophaga sp. 30R24 TaxID=3248838 RepID=UPI003B9081D0